MQAGLMKRSAKPRQDLHGWSTVAAEWMHKSMVSGKLLPNIPLVL